MLVFAIVALGVTVFYTSTGGIGSLVASVSRTVSAAAGSLIATSAPSATPNAISDPPTVIPPDQPYTNEATVDLRVTVPSSVIGKPGERVRIYLGLSGQAPAPIEEVAVGQTAELSVQVDLTKGQNNFSASIVGPGGESELSPVVTYVLDQDPPNITLTSPKNNATVNASTVKISGKTQAGSTVIVRNQTNGTSTTTTAADGTFSVSLGVDRGQNNLTLTSTDPAGNGASASVVVFGGSSSMTARLAASTYRLKAGQAQNVTLSVVVTDPSGRAVSGAQVTFSLTIPGLDPIQATTTTDSHGKASYVAKVGSGSTAGAGLAAVLVTTTKYGNASDQMAITVL
jgi:hypothetical protein